MKNRSLKVKRIALTSLSAAAFALFASPSHALGLGRLNVQSALGETLRAEIDITSLAPDEASSLQIRIASQETYRAAGVEYHPALAGARVSMARRSDGRPYLRLVTDRAVTEPFVDVILEMSWATGRLVREYTLLLDPPRAAAAQAPAPAPTAPVVTAPPARAPEPVAGAVASPPPPPPAAAPSPVAAAPAPAAAPAAAPTPPPAIATRPASPPPAPAAAPSAPARTAAARKPTPSAAAPAAKPSEVRVRSGDTLTAIAQRVQPAGVSLDQLLVSMFRTNPQAFSGDNMNRLRAGAILKVPDASDAQGVAQGEARSVIQAQAADFNAYRRRLASGVATAVDRTPSRQTGGKVQASVDDRKQAAAPTPDKLKLSQGAVKSTAPEAKISKESASKDASTRVAELSRNLDELKKVQGAAAAAAGTTAKAGAPAAPSSAPITLPVPAPVVPPKPAVAAAPPPAPAPAPAPPVVAPKPAVVASAPAAMPPVPAPVVAAASAPAVAKPASAPAAATPTPAPAVAATPASAVAAAKPDSAPAVAVAPKPSVPAVTPPKVAVDEPSMLDTILESPFVLPFGAVLAVGLAGFGIYRVRARGRKTAGETSFMESRLQPDSFFGASGGQRVDTHEGAGGAASTTSASSMNYSLSQLDAIGDVDPVAEADVYLAYGRDLQAEEILKEAMRTDPGRLAVRTKLLEVYAKRRDVKGFEVLANQLFTLTRGEGPDWHKAQELGRSIDAENPLYTPGGHPDALPDDEQFVEPLGASTMPQSVMPSPSSFGAPHDLLDDDQAGVSVSDVDIDLSFEQEPADPRMDKNRPMDATMPLTPATLASVGGLGAMGAMGAGVAAMTMGSVKASVNEVASEVLDALPKEPAGAVDMKISDRDALEFDLSDLSLDLDPPAPPSPSAVMREADRPDREARNSGFVDLSGLPDDPDSRFNDDGDPLERKLDLADEFRQIGDLEGARDLLNEVISHADGALRQKAQTMLDSLG